MGIPILIHFYFFYRLEIKFSEWTHLGLYGMFLLSFIIRHCIVTLIYYHIISLHGALYTSTVTYIIPITALMGGFIDGESIYILEMLGFAFILGSIKLIRRWKFYLIFIIDRSKGKDEGMFTALDIEPSSLIEICPLILIPVTQSAFIDKTEIYNYYFYGMTNSLLLPLVMDPCIII